MMISLCKRGRLASSLGYCLWPKYFTTSAGRWGRQQRIIICDPSPFPSPTCFCSPQSSHIRVSGSPCLHFPWLFRSRLAVGSSRGRRSGEASSPVMPPRQVPRIPPCSHRTAPYPGFQAQARKQLLARRQRLTCPSAGGADGPSPKEESGKKTPPPVVGEGGKSPLPPETGPPCPATVQNQKALSCPRFLRRPAQSSKGATSLVHPPAASSVQDSVSLLLSPLPPAPPPRSPAAILGGCIAL